MVRKRDPRQLGEGVLRFGLLLIVMRWPVGWRVTRSEQIEPRRGTRSPRQAPPRLFLNVSADEFTDPRLPVQLAAVLDEAGLVPTRLTLEITETGS